MPSLSSPPEEVLRALKSFQAAAPGLYEEFTKWLYSGQLAAQNIMRQAEGSSMYRMSGEESVLQYLVSLLDGAKNHRNIPDAGVRNPAFTGSENTPTAHEHQVPPASAEEESRLATAPMNAESPTMTNDS